MKKGRRSNPPALRFWAVWPRIVQSVDFAGEWRSLWSFCGAKGDEMSAGSIKAVMIAALLAGACASAPAAPEKLTDEAFKALLDGTAVRNSPGGDPFKEVRNISALMERQDLTDDQRLRALYRRAAIRANTGEDKLGAIADYGTLMATAPAGHELLERAEKNKAYAETQMGHINRRLAAGPEPDRAQYFNDLLTAGRHDEAAKFFRETGVKTIYGVEKLAKLGYLCEGEGYSGPSYTWGYDNTPTFTVRWCDTKAG